MPAVGVANVRSVSEVRNSLHGVPEWRELPPLGEERVPAIELGPSEFLGSQPCQDRGMELPNVSAARGDTPEKVGVCMTLLRGVRVSSADRDGRVGAFMPHFRAYSSLVHD